VCEARDSCADGWVVDGQSHAPTSILFFCFDLVIYLIFYLIIFDASEERRNPVATAVLRTFHILLKALGFTVYEKGALAVPVKISCPVILSVMPSLPRPHSRDTLSRIRHSTAFRPLIAIKKARTIQLVPTPLDDGIQLGDADRKVRTIQLER
jgi:hypothetical protein